MADQKHDMPAATGVNYSYGFLGLPDRRALAAQKRRAQKWLQIPGAL